MRVIRLIFYFLGITLITFSSGCSADYEPIQDSTRKFKMSSSSFDELLRNPKFNNSYSKILKSKVRLNNSQARTTLEDEFGFTIVEDMEARVIETDAITSYTFLISRDSVHTGEFENLIISIDSSGLSAAIILKYILNQPIHVVDEHDSYRIDANKEMTTLYNERSLAFYLCQWVMIPICITPGGQDGQDEHDDYHVAGNICTIDHYDVELVCTGGGNPGDATDQGDGGPAQEPGNNGGTPNPPPGPTVPTTPLPELGPKTTVPCAKLRAKFSETVYKNKVNALLASNVLGANHESGFGERKSIAYPYGPTYPAGVPSGLHQLLIPGGCHSFTHVHQNDVIIGDDVLQNIKIFSIDDVRKYVTTLQTNATTAGVPRDATYGVMVSSQDTYSIKLGNGTIPTISDEVWNNIHLAYEKECKDKAKANGIGNPISQEWLEKMFLRYMKKLGLSGILGLYRATPNTDFADWTKVTLKSDGSIFEDPCIYDNND